MAENRDQDNPEPMDRTAEDDLVGRANDEFENMEDLEEEEEESDISEK